MTTYWSSEAWLPTGVAERVRLTVADGVITAVTADQPPAPDDVRLTGVLLPGLANGHSHAFHRALRGRTHGDGGTFWTWRQQMYALARRLDPDRYLHLATAVYAEMALAGYTTVGEFHYLHHDPNGQPYADPNAMGHALIEAADRAGLRLTLLDTCYLAGGLTAAGHQPLERDQIRFGDGTVERWQDRWSQLRATPKARIGAAIHSVRAVPAADLAAVAGATPGPLHVHLSEQRAENLATQDFYGGSPTQLLADHGVLGPRTTAIHATHLTAADVHLLSSTGTACCFCPTTERDLADGIGPARDLLDAGSPLTLGSDQHAVIDPFEELRGLELHERLTSQHRGRFTPAQLMHAASAAGYASLGWPAGGTIAAGALADFVTVRTDSVRTVGSRAEQIAYAASAVDVDQVFVGGVPIVRDGRHRLGPIADLLRSSLSLLEVW
ncbi:MAG TPA: formimidoylglutamate deiminase [Propionibacteriaceae bacterium]|nr:formimidoylglutamate deiminase [Propionibacteriaceae bacterium]